MSVIHVGDLGVSLVELPNQPTKTRDNTDTFTLTFRYWCDGDLAEGLLPAVGAAPPGGVHPDLELTGVSITPHEAPGRVYVEITYAEPESTSFPPNNTVTQESETNYVEGDVKAHPTLSDADKTSLINAGRETYSIPSVTYRRLERKAISAFVFSESNIVGNVGKVDNTPNGLTVPTAGKWLATGKAARREGLSVEITEEWTFNSQGWNDVGGTGVNPFTVVP